MTLIIEHIQSTKKMDDLIIVEYYSAKCEVDEEGKMIPEYGEVSNSDLKKIKGYDFPVHRSLWKIIC